MRLLRCGIAVVVVGMAAGALSLGCGGGGQVSHPPDDTRILIVCKNPNLADGADVRAKLLATGFFFSVALFDATDPAILAPPSPGLAALNASYDAVLVMGDGVFKDGDVLGNDLKGYVDAGNGLAIAMFCHRGQAAEPPNMPDGLGSTFDAANYFAIPEVTTPPFDNQVGGSFGMNPGSVLAAHPILLGGGVLGAPAVVTGTWNGGTTCPRPNTTSASIVLGSTLVAEWSDGPAFSSTPLLVTRLVGPMTARRADLGLYPATVTTRPNGLPLASFQLIVNTMLWLCNKL